MCAALRSMISVDISEVVIRQMQQKHGSKGMTFSRGDLLNLEYSDGEFSCVLDKGTLDALYTHDDVETGKMVDTMFQVGTSRWYIIVEVSRHSAFRLTMRCLTRRR